MTTRQRNGALLAIVLAVAVALFVKSGAVSGPAGAPTVLDAVPESSFLVLTLDVPGLRASPLADALAPLFGALGDADQVKKACGFDPFDRVRTVAIAVPEESGGDFGIVLRGALTQSELVECAKKAIAARGGSPGVGPDSAHPEFVRVRDGSTFASMSSPELALGKDGPFLLGRGAWLDKMIATSAGAAPSVVHNARHMDLRRALGGEEHAGTEGRTALLTVLLPAALRTRLKGEMAEDGGLSDPMSGVLGVESAGLALSAGDAGGTTEIAAELRCESPAACAEVAKVLETKRAAWSKLLAVRFLGLGPLVDGLVLEKHDTSLDAHVALPADDAGRIVAKLVALRQGRGSAAPGGAEPPGQGGPAGRPGPRPVPPLPTPDEVVRPRR